MASEVIQPLPELLEYKAVFNRLQPIVYRTIRINGIALRILGIHHMDYGPAWSVGTHHHTFYECHYVTARQTWTTTNDLERRIEAGCFYLMPPGTWHAHREDGVAGHEGIAFRWEFLRPQEKDALAADASTEMEQLPRLLEHAHTAPIRDDGQVMAAIRSLLDLSAQDAGILKLQLAFVRILLELSAFYRADSGMSGRQEVSRKIWENGIVAQAIRFIDENYHQAIDSQDIAHSVHMSFSQLTRLFRAETGQSIRQYLQQCRLRQAQKLLLCTNRSLAQIAAETGFESAQYFCAAFKRVFSISPGAFRQNKGQLNE